MELTKPTAATLILTENERQLCAMTSRLLENIYELIQDADCDTIDIPDYALFDLNEISVSSLLLAGLSNKDKKEVY